jgi:threonine dehydratase
VLEVLEDLPGVDAIVAPVGGGGLLSGIAIAAKAVSAAISVTGVEAAASTAFSSSLAAGHIVEVRVGPTIADGLAGNMDPDTITFGIVQRLVDSVVVAPEDQIVEAIGGLVAEEHLIAEGAGAAGVAGLLAERVPARGRQVVVVVSGANIDVERLQALLRPV